VISLVVANEEERDQRKRRLGCNPQSAMLLLRWGQEAGRAGKVCWKAAPERVIVP